MAARSPYDTHIGYMSIGALRYGGIETDVYQVVFFDLWQPRPVFHRHAHGKAARDRGDDPTVCGRPTWDIERRRIIGTSIPTGHASVIGRPCHKCWPEWEDPEDSE